MRVLATNDDGVHAPGLHALAWALDEYGYDVVVVAPLSDRSGSGGAIGPIHVSGTVSYKEVELEGLRHVPAFGIDGPPALAVLATCLGGFGPPPVVVASGVNAGLNTGVAVLHSGTVGAALTAANLGRPAVAVSLAYGPEPRWASAATIARAAVSWVAAGERPTVLNVNVPNVALRHIRGVRKGILATNGAMQAGFVPAADGHLQLELWEPGASAPPNSDAALLKSGYVSITELAGIAAMSGATVDALPTLIEDELLEAVKTA